MPVRIGRPQKIGGLADAFDNPEYATTVGLTLWGMKQGLGNSGNTASRPQIGLKTEEGIGFLAKWLKSFLPKD